MNKMNKMDDIDSETEKHNLGLVQAKIRELKMELRAKTETFLLDACSSKDFDKLSKGVQNIILHKMLKDFDINGDLYHGIVENSVEVMMLEMTRNHEFDKLDLFLDKNLMIYVCMNVLVSVHHYLEFFQPEDSKLGEKIAYEIQTRYFQTKKR